MTLTSADLDDLANLDALLDALQARQRARAEARPVLNAAGEDISAQAATGRLIVSPGDTIASLWGNTTYDQTMQVFLNNLDRDTQWPTPHDGAMCFTVDTGTAWLRRSGAWALVMPIGGPRGLVASAQGPPTGTDYSSYVGVSGCNATFTPLAGRRYLAYVWAQGTVVSAASTQVLASFRGGADRIDPVNTLGLTIAANGVVAGTGYLEPTTTPGTSYTLGATTSTTGGAYRVPVNGFRIHILDVGGS